MTTGSATAPPTASTPWERSAEVLWRRTAAGVVVLPNDSSAAVTLEGLHAAMWEALSRPMTIDGLADQLAALVPEETAAANRTTAEAVRFLVAMGAVQESMHP